jgi:oligopeptide/dipeptide ABC transporter ATP-binding protein
MLDVKNLKTQFLTEHGPILAVDDVSFSVKAGQVLGIVGESGCGKSVTALSIMRLIQNPGSIVGGEIIFKDQSLLQISDEKMRALRGNQISMIFQEPMTSLNPVFTCGYQVEEVIRLHQPNLSKKETHDKALSMLKLVGIPAPEKRFHEYPHQLSGGMRQRIMIAMAMSCRPQLLLADEPTTALDVTIQAQILELMKDLIKKSQTALVLITHDLGVVAEMCDQVIVMYAGKIIEQGSVEDIFYRPRHPYTRGLLDSIPPMSSEHHQEKLKTIPGMVPALTHLPQGCRFYDRCFQRQEKCQVRHPDLEKMSESQAVACYFPLAIDQKGAH